MTSFYKFDYAPLSTNRGGDGRGRGEGREGRGREEGGGKGVISNSLKLVVFLQIAEIIIKLFI